MPFKFVWLCELLEELYQQRHRKRATNSKNDNPDHRIVTAWIDKYDDKIQRSGPSAIALLSALFPERRPDRVYHAQENRLSQIFGRALGLGFNRARLLCEWKTRHGSDFPTCVEQVMADCEFDPPPSSQQVTLEEIDLVLDQIAARSSASAPALKTKADGRSVNDLISSIVHRLQSWEAKWFVRMLLKSYSPIEIPEYAALHGFHFMLPRLLQIQSSLQAAATFLERPEIRTLPPRPSKDYEKALQPIFAQSIKPQLGVMIKRQPYWKARSIKHCCNMAAGRIMSVEQKYDGEYVQVHVDPSKGEDCIQIFSKSGKDSTRDRVALRGSIAAGLNLHHSGCRIKTSCILEGELLVWDKDEKRILPFHKIRKHVKHGGRFLGNQQDSPYSLNEQLMIVLYDVLMLDDKLLLTQKHTQRRSQLKALVTQIEGSVHLVDRQLIDFRSTHAPRQLREAFASSIVKRWEGLVLKGVDDAYFSWNESTHVIKLKKDYITGLGDIADLCIVGGRRDAKVEAELGLGKLSWTMFHLACLLNKPMVQRYDAKPQFRIIDVIGHHSLCPDDILELNARGTLLEIPYKNTTQHLNVTLGSTSLPAPTELFSGPLIVEIMGSGFERPVNANFWSLRFPRKTGSRLKIHMDRDLSQTMSFDELQEVADKVMTVTQHPDEKEDAHWIAKLLEADPASKYLEDKSQSTTPSITPKSATTASLSPKSVRRRNTPRSPVLVRADSFELTAAERAQRRHGHEVPQSISTTSSTATPDSVEMARYLKRKPCDANISPLEALVSKRAKVVYDLSSPSRIHCERAQTIPNVTATTAPSLTRQGNVITIAENPSPSNVLSELTNVSADTAASTRRRTNISRPYNGSPILNSRTAGLRKTQEEARGKEEVDPSCPTTHIPLSSSVSRPTILPFEIHDAHATAMLTPPSSSEVVASQKDPVLRNETSAGTKTDTSVAIGKRALTTQVEATSNVIRAATREDPSSNRNKHEHERPQTTPVPPNPSTQRKPPPPPSLPSLPFLPPILIGRSVLANQHARATLLSRLYSLPGSFTFSVAAFVTDIICRGGQPYQQEKGQRPCHMLLVDSSNAETANCDLRALARELTRRDPRFDTNAFGGGGGGNSISSSADDSTTREGPREPLILVFDHNILTSQHHPLPEATATSATKRGEERNNEGSRSLAVDWERMCVTNSKPATKKHSDDGDGNGDGNGDGDAGSSLFCGVADVTVQKGQGWGGRDAFSVEMKWDWTWLEEIMGNSATAGVRS